MKRVTVGFALVGALALAGCGSDGSAPPISDPFAPNLTTLTDTSEWRATGLNRAGGLVEPAGGTTVTLAFAKDLTFSGTGGCNQLSGSYSAQGQQLVFGPIGSTKRACDGPGEQQDAALKQALEQTQVYAIRGRSLELRNGTGTVLAAFLAVTAQSAPPNALSEDPAR